MNLYPINYVWQKVDVVDPSDGVIAQIMAMVPQPRYRNLAAKQFSEGEEHTLAPVEERSMASHKQFFAALKSGYDNLPEKLFFRTNADGSFVLDDFGNRVPKWPTPEHYRKWLLINAGYFEETEFEGSSHGHALQLAAWARKMDVFAKIIVRGNFVIVQHAMSQSLAAMKKAKFQESKEAVLALNDALTGVAPGTHRREAAKHA